MTSHPALLQTLVGQVPTHEASVMMLAGPSGVGKRILAEAVAAQLLHTPSTRIAGHPDVSVLRPEADSRAGIITVEQARKAIASANLSPARGGRRVLIVNDVDSLNNAAANALLKTLEEPPRSLLALLIVDALAEAPATLRSRARIVRVPAPDRETAITALSAARPELTSDQVAALTDLARNRPGRAVAMADADGLSTYQDLVDLIRPAGQGQRIDRVRLTRFLSERGSKPGAADMVAVLIERLAQAATAARGPIPAVRDEADLLSQLAARRSPGAWARLRIEADRLLSRAAALNMDTAGAVARILTHLDPQRDGL